MGTQQIILLIINILGGAAVIGSYIFWSKRAGRWGRCSLGRRAGEYQAGVPVSP